MKLSDKVPYGNFEGDKFGAVEAFFRDMVEEVLSEKAPENE